MRPAFHPRKRSCALRDDMSSHQQSACRECTWEGTGEQSRSHRALSLSCCEGARQSLSSQGGWHSLYQRKRWEIRDGFTEHLLVQMALPASPSSSSLPPAPCSVGQAHSSPSVMFLQTLCCLQVLEVSLRLQVPAQRLEGGKPVVWLFLLPKDSIHGQSSLLAPISAWNPGDEKG